MSTCPIPDRLLPEVPFPGAQGVAIARLLFRCCPQIAEVLPVGPAMEGGTGMP